MVDLHYIMKYIMNIIIYLRSKMRDSEASTRDCGTSAFFVGQSRGIWDGWQVCAITAVSTVYNRRVKVKSHACAVSLGNCGTIELLRGTAGQ